MARRAKRLTVEAIYDGKSYDEKSLRQPQWLKDGRRLSYLDDWPGTDTATVWAYDSVTHQREALLDPGKLREEGAEKALPVHGVQWSPNEKLLLLTEEAPARFKSHGNLFVYDLETGVFRRLTRTDLPQRHARFAPDSQSVGLVRADNLWTVSLATGEERQLTFDATDTTYNGRFGWVYEEELGLGDGWWWSPDGARIAYCQQDESAVPEVLLPQYEDLHGAPLRTRYPKAGDPNPTVRLGVMVVATGDTGWLALPGDAEEEHYVARVQWTPAGDGLLVQRIPRLQNRLDVLLVDPDTGAVQTLFAETDDAWVDSPGEVRFVGKSGRFLWLSERDGWRHIYLYDLCGRMLGRLTSGPWEVSDIAGVDAERGRVYFHAARPDPTQRHLYWVGLEGGEPVRVTEGPGWHRGHFSEDGKQVVHTHSTLNTPPVTVLRDADGRLDDTLLAEAAPGLAGRPLGRWETLTFDTSDGETLWARMLKPTDFDPARRYPVWMSTYGGPGSQVVTDSWGGKGGLWYQLLAQRGYLVFLLDNRGTGGRGRDFKKQTYLRLGHWEVNDQVEGARYLARLPYVNPKRIGIWGWSYGGYMAAMCILRGADAFRASVAVAPVTDWALYDTIYTERYMRRPVDNPDGYKESAPVTHAEKLKGRLLIVHGTMDDNVHFQNSARLAAALQDAKKPFAAMLYPGKRHGIEDRHLHLFRLLTEFVLRNV